MGGRNPKSRGVLASLLGVPGEPVKGATEPIDLDGESFPDRAERPDIESEAPASDLPAAAPTEERESYEPGWYRISLARSETHTEDTEAPSPVLERGPSYGEVLGAFDVATDEVADTSDAGEGGEEASIDEEPDTEVPLEELFEEPEDSSEGSIVAGEPVVEEPVVEELTLPSPPAPIGAGFLTAHSEQEEGAGVDAAGEEEDMPRRETTNEDLEAEMDLEAEVEPEGEDDDMAPVPAGMREAYEPGWYRITVARPDAGTPASRPVDATEEERTAPQPRRGVSASRRSTSAPRRRPFARRWGRRGDTPEPSMVSESVEPAGPPAAGSDLDLGAVTRGDNPVSDQLSNQPSTVDPSAPSEYEYDTVAEPTTPPSTPLDPGRGAPSLVSLAAKERRAALEHLAHRGLGEGDVATVSALVSDPERDIRALAVETLRQRPELVEPEVVRRALQDPTDEVRAAAIRLTALRNDPDLAALSPLVGARRWPLTQSTALDVLPDLIERFRIEERALDALLFAVAGMESSPVGDERGGFLELTRAVGHDQLIACLDLQDDRRLGAVRLLLEEGSSEALRAVAEHVQDPLDEVRIAATSAKDQLAASQPEPPAIREPEPEPVFAAPPPSPVPVRATPEPEPEAEPEEISPVEVEIISGLARALEDPDEGVRERAARALEDVNRSSLVMWTRQALASHDPREASLGAAVVEAATLHELAGDLLDRASRVGPEARGPFVGALSSLGLESGELVALARSIDASHRPDTVRLLWQAVGRRVLPHLRDMLDDTSGPVRVAVLEVFGESGDPSAIEVAHGVLERDSSPVVRATAIQVIGRAGLDQRTASLSQALNDPDPDVRATAVELLPQGMVGQAGDLLLEALRDEDDRVWQPAMRHLVSLPERDLPVLWTAVRQAPPERRSHLITLLERTSHERLASLALEHLASPDHDDRILAISLASRAGTSEAVEGIIGTLVDPVPAVRRAGATALAQLRSPEAIPALSQALNDPDVGVREESLRTLSEIDDERVLDPLIESLKDPEARVRDVATEALTRWSSPAVARRLVEALTSPVLRGPASELLARMGTSAVDPLVNLLREGHPDIASTVGETLERLVGRDVFLERLSSMDPNERMSAVEALGAMGGLEAVEGLIRALSDPNEDIRVRALRLLGDLGDRRALEAVERAVHGDPVPEVVAAAEDALRRLQVN